MSNFPSPIRRFFSLLALEKKEIVTIYFFSGLSGLIYLSLPLGIQSIINLLFGGLVSTSLVVLIGVVLAGVFLNGWLEILQMRVNERIQRRIFTRFSMQFAYKIPRIDLISVDDYYLPELVNRFFDTASLQKGLSKVLLDFPAAIVQIIFGVALLSFYNAWFLFLGLLLIFVVIMIIWLSYNRGIRTSLAESDYKYEVGYWLEEVARTVKIIKFMGMTDYPIRRADRLVSGYLDARREHFNVLIFQYWAFVFFKIAITAALLIMGSVLVIEQQINLGQFIASEIVILLLLNSIEKLIGSLDVVYDMLTSLEKVNYLLDKPMERTGGLNILEVCQTEGLSVRAENLSYRYSDGDKLILHDINFEINAGEKVCIFGTQGSGKTTLLRLLTGAYMNFEGKLLINEYPIGNYDLKLLRQEIGVYLASADLFSGTLLENLTLGDETITHQFIFETASHTGLLPYIQSLREGLYANIDSAGKKLPRNVVNKILLTRALLTKPKLLLLEDCWSGLELAEQENMINYLTGESCKTTLIAITNDELFASRCNKIILLENGTVSAVGSFEEVRATSSYKRMFKLLSL
ncbi:MAG: ABC transporter ATP-binding protein/permease [Chitinophagales bacterium]|nr:ABC transporter ATP-binding protein/permease [Chitinophagales bacterium]MDW8419045.1 ABC transporter ATP-binding protein [Chitinophagales bacterium]